jgi:hypothetical protein
VSGGIFFLILFLTWFVSFTYGFLMGRMSRFEKEGADDDG